MDPADQGASQLGRQEVIHLFWLDELLPVSVRGLSSLGLPPAAAFELRPAGMTWGPVNDPQHWQPHQKLLFDAFNAGTDNNPFSGEGALLSCLVECTRQCSEVGMKRGIICQPSSVQS